MAQRISTDDGRIQIAPRVLESAWRLAAMDSRGGATVGLTRATARCAVHVEDIRVLLGDDLEWPEARPDAADLAVAGQTYEAVAGDEATIAALRQAVISSTLMWSVETLERIDRVAAELAGWSARKLIVGDADAAERLFRGVAEASAARRLTEGGDQSLVLNTLSDVEQFCDLSSRKLREIVMRLGTAKVRGQMMERISAMLVDQGIVGGWEGFYAGTRHEKAAKNSSDLGLYAVHEPGEDGDAERVLYRLRCAVFGVLDDAGVPPDLLRVVTNPFLAARDSRRYDGAHTCGTTRTTCPVCEIDAKLDAYDMKGLLDHANHGVVSISVQMMWSLHAAQVAHIAAGCAPAVLLASPARAPNGAPTATAFPQPTGKYDHEFPGNARSDAHAAEAIFGDSIYLLQTGVERSSDGLSAAPIQWGVVTESGVIDGESVITKSKGKGWDLVYRSPDLTTVIDELKLPVKFQRYAREFRVLRVKGDPEPNRTLPTIHVICPVTLRGNPPLANAVGRLLWRVHGREEYAEHIRTARRASLNASNRVLAVRGRSEAQEPAWELLRQIAAVGRLLRVPPSDQPPS